MPAMKGMQKPSRHSPRRGNMGTIPGVKRPAIKKDGRPKSFSGRSRKSGARAKNGRIMGKRARM